MKRSSLLLAISLLIACALGASPVKVAVRFEPQATLPGVPTQVVYTVTNHGNQPVTVPPTISLLVQPEKGEAFFAETPTGMRTVSMLPDIDEPFVLNEGETREFIDPLLSRLTSPEWFADRRITAPGIYAITLIVGEYRRLSFDKWEIGENAEASREGETSHFPTVRSPAVRLTVEEPRGEDATVWARLTELSDNKGWGASEWSIQGDKVAEEIWTYHPNSRYAQMVAYMVQGAPELRVQHLQRAIDIDPKSMYSDELRLLMVGIHEWEMGRAQTAQYRNQDLAVKSRDSAAKLLESLVDSPNTSVRKHARQALRELPTEPEIRQKLKQ